MSTQDSLSHNLVPPQREATNGIKSIWLKYGEKIVILIGIILVAAISFEAGYLKGVKSEKSDIVINKLESAAAVEDKANQGNLCSCANTNPSELNDSQAQAVSAGMIDTKNCLYVASKNSDKYHLATCQWTARIKPENRVCFSSVEEAKNRGYQGAKCCIK